MRELRPGLWHWQARHPWWEDGEPWGRDVSSYAIDHGARLLLFDPLSVPDELLELAADREPIIVLTAPWHERDTQSLISRLGAPLYAPPPDTAADLMEKFGITRERAGDSAAPTSSGCETAAARRAGTELATTSRSASRRSSGRFASVRRPQHRRV